MAESLGNGVQSGQETSSMSANDEVDNIFIAILMKDTKIGMAYYVLNQPNKLNLCQLCGTVRHLFIVHTL